MKVKQLIRELLEMPLDAEVVVYWKDAEYANYHRGENVFTTNYEDGTVGIIGKEETNVRSRT